MTADNPTGVSTGATNAKELIFDKLDGGYKLATAGTKDVGRSNTAHLLHGSELGFGADAQMHLAGIGNTTGDIPDTEIILELTGNGLGNAFHLMSQDAEARPHVSGILQHFQQRIVKRLVQTRQRAAHRGL